MYLKENVSVFEGEYLCILREKINLFERVQPISG